MNQWIKRFIKSIKLKLIIIITGIAVLLLLLQGIVAKNLHADEASFIQKKEQVRELALSLDQTISETMANTTLYRQSLKWYPQVQQTLARIEKQTWDQFQNKIVQAAQKQLEAGIYQEDGTILYHTSPGLAGKNNNQGELNPRDKIPPQTLGINQEFLEYTVSNPHTRKIAYVVYNPVKRWIIVAAQRHAPRFPNISRLLLNLCTLIIILILAVAGSVFLIKYFTKPISHLKQISQQLSNGDFTVKVEINREDEFGELYKAYDYMIESLRMLIIDSKNMSQIIEESSRQSIQMIDRAMHETLKITSDTTAIAEGASVQAQEVDATEKKVHLLDETAGILKSDSDIMQSTATHMKNMTIEGVGVIKDLIRRQDASKEAMEKLIARINLLNEHMGEINEFTNTIIQIAEQTNLLSLNASIEAARAGEHGKGFGVVAKDVKKLADKASSSAKYIQEKILQIDTYTNEASEAAKQAVNIFEIQNEFVYSTEVIFKELEAEVSNSVENINSVYEQFNRLESVKNEVVGMITKIAEISRETTQTTHIVSGTVQEQLNAMKEVLSFVNRTAGEIVNMKICLDCFKIDG
jgi:methyl-accepting chemotaxis protein